MKLKMNIVGIGFTVLMQRNTLLKNLNQYKRPRRVPSSQEGGKKWSATVPAACTSERFLLSLTQGVRLQPPQNACILWK